MTTVPFVAKIMFGSWGKTLKSVIVWDPPVKCGPRTLLQRPIWRTWPWIWHLILGGPEGKKSIWSGVWACPAVRKGPRIRAALSQATKMRAAARRAEEPRGAASAGPQPRLGRLT